MFGFIGNVIKWPCQGKTTGGLVFGEYSFCDICLRQPNFVKISVFPDGDLCVFPVYE